jgi:hypothetical protein
MIAEKIAYVSNKYHPVSSIIIGIDNMLMDSEMKIRLSTDQRDIRAEIFVSDFLKNLEAFPKVLPTLTKIPLLVG